MLHPSLPFVGFPETISFKVLIVDDVEADRRR